MARVRGSVKRTMTGTRSKADVRIRLDHVPGQRWYAESFHTTLRPGRLIHLTATVSGIVLAVLGYGPAVAPCSRKS